MNPNDGQQPPATPPQEPTQFPQETAQPESVPVTAPVVPTQDTVVDPTSASQPVEATTPMATTPVEPMITPVAQPIVSPMQQPLNPAMPPIQGSKSFPLPIIIAAVLGVIILGGIALFATKLMNKTEKSSTSSLSPTSQSSTTGTTADEKKEEAPASATGKKVIEVNKTVNDSVMGVDVTFKRVIIDAFPVPAKYAEAQSDKVVVVVDFDIKNSGKYAMKAKTQLLYIMTTREIPYVDSSTTMVNEIKAAGYTNLEDSNERSHASGVKAYYVKKSEIGNLTLRYKRQAAGVLGTDQTISAQNFDVPVKQ